MPFEKKVKIKLNVSNEGNAPEVVQQMLRWDFVKSVIVFLFGAFIFLKAHFSLVSLNAKKKEIDKATFNAQALIYLLIFIISAVLMFKSVAWAEILIAPKWYVIEQITEMVR